MKSSKLTYTAFLRRCGLEDTRTTYKAFLEGFAPGFTERSRRAKARYIKSHWQARAEEAYALQRTFLLQSQQCVAYINIQKQSKL